MFQQLPLGMCGSHILLHAASQSGCHHLDAPANAQERYLPVESQARQHQFAGIALRIDAAERSNGFLVQPERVDVRSAREQHAVHAVKQLHQLRSRFAAGRHHHRQSARSLHCPEIARQELQPVVGKVARDGDERLLFAPSVQAFPAEAVEFIR